MNVLLTGGAGFIGSHIADHLLADGHEVFVIDNLSSGRRSNVPEGAGFRELDIRDSAVGELWAEHRFDAIVHMAAQMNVRASVDDPCFDADVNLVGLLNLMEHGRRHGLRRVIFAGSGGAAYDDNAPHPTPEHEPPNPLSPYGIAKVASEMYLEFYRETYGITYTVLRIANAYGPRQNPHGEAGVIAIFAERLLAGERPVIFGSGRQTRDYVYCEDLARICTIVLERDENDVYHAGTGIETDVLQLLAMIQQHAGTEVEPEFAPAKPGENMRSSLAIGKARERLGWTPEIDLDHGIRRTVEFFRRKQRDPDAR
ncbi:MAG: UDP-glucose 4-epimerase [Calditrichaeota bacterium]|nr:UDP-glucose 4-epimerase [Calditrichota bacterium]